jgi:hypothetical protein
MAPPGTRLCPPRFLPEDLVKTEESMAEQGRKRGTGPANEGEGNKTAARHYNEAQRRFAQSGKVDKSAREAEKAIEGEEARELERAEETGKGHGHGEDPAVKPR